MKINVNLKLITIGLILLFNCSDADLSSTQSNVEGSTTEKEEQKPGELSEPAEDIEAGVSPPTFINGGFLTSNIGCSFNRKSTHEATLSCDVLKSDTETIIADEISLVTCRVFNKDTLSSEKSQTVQEGTRVSCEPQVTIDNVFTSEIEITYSVSGESVKAREKTELAIEKSKVVDIKDLQSCLSETNDFLQCDTGTPRRVLQFTGETPICEAIYYQASDHRGGAENYSRIALTSLFPEPPSPTPPGEAYGCMVCDRFPNDGEYNPNIPICPICNPTLIVDQATYGSESQCLSNPL